MFLGDWDWEQKNLNHTMREKNCSRKTWLIFAILIFASLIARLVLVIIFSSSYREYREEDPLKAYSIDGANDPFECTKVSESEDPRGSHTCDRYD